MCLNCEVEIRDVRALAARARSGPRGPCWPIAICARIIAASTGWRANWAVPCGRYRALFFRADRGLGRTGIDPDICHGAERMRPALRFLHHGAQSWNPRPERRCGPKCGPDGRAGACDGARTIMVLGGEPTIHLPAALEFVAACRTRRDWSGKPTRMVRPGAGVAGRNVRRLAGGL